MNGRRVYLALGLLVCCSMLAIGCGSSFPLNPSEYTVQLERVKGPEGLDPDLVLVQVEFPIYLNDAGVDVKTVLTQCSSGTCGSMASFSVDAKVSELVSSTCVLNVGDMVDIDTDEDGTMEKRRKVDASCVVPVRMSSMISTSKEYSVMITALATDGKNGAFLSSPAIQIDPAVLNKS